MVRVRTPTLSLTLTLTLTLTHHSDFANTEIPFDFPLPEQQHLGEAEREKVLPLTLTQP